MRKLPLLLLISILIFGCNADPMSRKSSDNPEIVYEYLFTIKEENVRVYRFMDGGGYKYIAVTDCGNAQPIFEVKEGKANVPNTIHPVEKRTLEAK